MQDPPLVHHSLLHCQQPSANGWTRVMALHLAPTPFRQSPRLKGTRHCSKVDRIQTFSWPLHNLPLFARLPRPIQPMSATGCVDTTLIIRLLKKFRKRKNHLPDRDSSRGKSVSTKYCRSMRHEALLCPMLHSAVI